jgi:membrane-bound lytic murein transglycosylase B
MYRFRGLGASTQDMITAAATKYGVPPSLALAVAQRESGLNQSAVGTSGEIGVFQLMPGTATQLGVNPSDLSQNIDGGVRYLSQLSTQYGGDWHTALEAYNGGPGNVARGTVSSAAVAYADALAPFASTAAPDSSVSGPVDESDDSGGAVLSFDSPVLLAGLGLAAIALIFAFRSWSRVIRDALFRYRE